MLRISANYCLLLQDLYTLYTSSVVVLISQLVTKFLIKVNIRFIYIDEIRLVFFWPNRHLEFLLQILHRSDHYFHPIDFHCHSPSRFQFASDVISFFSIPHIQAFRQLTPKLSSEPLATTSFTFFFNFWVSRANSSFSSNCSSCISFTTWTWSNKEFHFLRLLSYISLSHVQLNNNRH